MVLARALEGVPKLVRTASSPLTFGALIVASKLRRKVTAMRTASGVACVRNVFTIGGSRFMSAWDELSKGRSRWMLEHWENDTSFYLFGLLVST